MGPFGTGVYRWDTGMFGSQEVSPGRVLALAWEKTPEYWSLGHYSRHQYLCLLAQGLSRHLQHPQSQCVSKHLSEERAPPTFPWISYCALSKPEKIFNYVIYILMTLHYLIGNIDHIILIQEGTWPSN